MRILAVLVLALAGCAYVGGQVSPSPAATSVPATTDPTATATAPPTAEPTAGPTATPEDRDAQRRAQAEAALQHWADFMADKPADTIVFIWGLSRGGGGEGRHAGEKKQAFMEGRFEAVVDLPTEVPPPAEVTWADGSQQQFELISAVHALDELIAETRSDSVTCGDCLKIVGATLTSLSMPTWRGDVTVPVWQFEFAPGDEPAVPLTRVAIKDAVGPEYWDNWGRFAPTTDGAYGAPADTEITVAFGGGVCDTGHSITAVESDLAIVPIISTTVRPGPCILPRVGYALLLQLGAPLGERAVLDLENGWPAPVYAEAPANWPSPEP